MGASLLAKAVSQSVEMLNLPASSRASPLPQEERGPTKNQVGYQAASWWTLISGAPLTTMALRGGPRSNAFVQACRA
ncbi:hypothetical protein EMIT043CA1_140185 [Pseudomonas brassicacearum]